MKRFLFCTVFLLFQAALVHGQYTRDDGNMKQPDKEGGFSLDRVYIGGSLGAQFGTFTFINLSPDVGYWFTDRFAAGVGGRYMYFNDRVFNFSTTIVGGSVFGRYLITDEIFAHAEYEVINGRFDRMREESFNVHSLFVGGGYIQSFGDRFFSGIMLLYNINESIYSPYRNPIIRVTFGLGI